MNTARLSEDEIERRRFVRVSNHFFVRSSKAGNPLAGDDEKIAGIVHDIHGAVLAFMTDQSQAVSYQQQLKE